MRKPTPRQLELSLESGRNDVSTAHIAFGPRLIAYTVKRGRRRPGSFSLAIDERGLRIGAPRHASERWIEGVLRKHENWILRKLDEWQRRRPSAVRWEDGASLMFLGEPLPLAFVPGPIPPAKDGNRLLIGIDASHAGGMAARAVTAWLREQALGCFKERVAHYAPPLGVVAREVRLSAAKTRWGSCHAAGKILINWRLIQMPLRLIDYVVVHELAHLKEMNHSPRFWAAVGELIPDYAVRRKEIRGDAHRYLLL
ncbi:MAG: M48 family metallopeptidase [Betaproteobacteria bacterium]